jgi:hypothetical protein
VRMRLSPGAVRSGGAPADSVQFSDGKRPPVFGNGKMRSGEYGEVAARSDLDGRVDKNGEWGLDGSFSSNQRRERGLGVCSVQPSGGEAGGLGCVEEKGKEGPRRRLWMVGDWHRQWCGSGGHGRGRWSGDAIEASCFGPAQDEQNGFPFI